jgi:hypothetical protein
MTKRCNFFRVPERSMWEVQLIRRGGDPAIEGRNSANPEYRAWMDRFGHLADRVMPAMDVAMCGEVKVDQCGFGECEYMAEYLCDWPMGNGSTCDLPICRRHAVGWKSNVHFCPVHQVVLAESGRAP